MNKQIIVSVILVILFLSCETNNIIEPYENIDTLKTVIDSSYIDSLRYYPLQIGNYWEYLEIESRGSSIAHYIDSLIYSLEVIKDTIIQDTLRYFIFHKKGLYSSSWNYFKNEFVSSVSNLVNTKMLLRISSDGKIYKYQEGFQDHLFFDAMLGKNEYYMGGNPSEPAFRLKNILKGIGKSKILGLDLETKSYSCQDYESYISADRDFQLAKDIGFINSSHITGGTYEWQKTEKILFARINEKNLGSKFIQKKDSTSLVMPRVDPYFPLQIGNYWEYIQIINDGFSVITDKDSLIYSLEVISDTSVNNKKYHKLKIMGLYSSSWHYINGLRINDHQYIDKYIYIYNSPNEAKFYLTTNNFDEHTLMIDGVLKVGETYSGISPAINEQHIPSTYRYRQLADDIIFGQNTQMKYYELMGYTFDYKLAKDIGYVGSSWYSGGTSGYSRVENLTYVNISGKNFGSKFQK